jgi:hypothetical protein
MCLQLLRFDLQPSKVLRVVIISTGVPYFDSYYYRAARTVHI